MRVLLASVIAALLIPGPALAGQGAFGRQHQSFAVVTGQVIFDDWFSPAIDGHDFTQQYGVSIYDATRISPIAITVYVQAYFDHIGTWVTVCNFRNASGAVVSITNGVDKNYVIGFAYDRQTSGPQGACTMPAPMLFRFYFDVTSVPSEASTYTFSLAVQPIGGNP